MIDFLIFFKRLNDFMFPICLLTYAMIPEIYYDIEYDVVAYFAFYGIFLMQVLDDVRKFHFKVKAHIITRTELLISALIKFIAVTCTLTTLFIIMHRLIVEGLKWLNI